MSRAEPIRPQWCDHCRTDRFRNDTCLLENGSECKQGDSTDLTILGHDDWLIIATTPDDPGPWYVVTEMWPQHQEPDRREPGRDSNFRAVCAYLATLLPTDIADLGWFRYDTDPPLSARQMEMLRHHKAKATS